MSADVAEVDVITTTGATLPFVMPTIPVATRRLAYVLPNYMWAGMSRPTMVDAPVRIKGLPDTCPLMNGDLVPLTEEKQEFMFAILRQSAPSMSLADLKTAWASLTTSSRAFTNKHGWDAGYADYINGVNVGGPPMLWQPLVNFALLAVIGDPLVVRGVQCWQFHAFDADAPLPLPEVCNPDTDPHLFTLACSSVRAGFDSRTGKWAREDIEEPFWQLDGADVPFPIWTHGPINYIPCNRTVILEPGEPLPSPYHA